MFVSDIAIFVLKRDVKLQLTDYNVFQAALQYYVDATYCYRRSSVVCLSVCLSVTIVNPAKSAEPIEMSFGDTESGRVGPGNHVLGGVHIDATWRIRLNRPCADAVRQYVK